MFGAALLHMRCNDLQHLAQYFRVAGHDVAAFQPAFVALHVGYDAACFLHQQRSGSDVPRFEVELEKAVQTPAGDGTQVERGGTFAAAAGGFGQKVFQNGEVGLETIILLKVVFVLLDCLASFH